MAREFILKPMLAQVNNLQGSIVGDGYNCKETFNCDYVCAP
jgi:hypothetical protein